MLSIRILQTSRLCKSSPCFASTIPHCRPHLPSVLVIATLSAHLQAPALYHRWDQIFGNRTKTSVGYLMRLSSSSILARCAHLLACGFDADSHILQDEDLLAHGLIVLWELVENQASHVEGREADIFSVLLHVRYCNKINVSKPPYYYLIGCLTFRPRSWKQPIPSEIV